MESDTSVSENSAHRDVTARTNVAQRWPAAAGIETRQRTARVLKPAWSVQVSASSLVIGVDVVRVSEVLESLERFGDRYAKRVFTDPEIAYCRAASPHASAERFAARFAAKEAAFKALRGSRSDGISWRSIEVARSPEGWCEIVLHGAAAELARREGIAELTLSMSHERDYAMASVIGRREQGGTTVARETHVRSTAKLAGRGDHAQPH